MMGVALGCIHLSMDDFLRMTPKEFGAVSEQWRKQEERESQERWEIMRMHACIDIQPHVKKKMTPQGLLPFPWEKKAKRAEMPTIGKEEAKARFLKLVKG